MALSRFLHRQVLTSTRLSRRRSSSNFARGLVVACGWKPLSLRLTARGTATTTTNALQRRVATRRRLSLASVPRVRRITGRRGTASGSSSLEPRSTFDVVGADEDHGWRPVVSAGDRNGQGAGTDKFAGQEARFFMSGRSTYIIRFNRLDAEHPLAVTRRLRHRVCGCRRFRIAASQAVRDRSQYRSPCDASDRPRGGSRCDR